MDRIAAYRPKALPNGDFALAIAFMEGDRSQRAVARIEAALARIEAAARQPRPVASSDSELVERHARLREAVGRSLSQLDALIAEQGR